jgi:hypothetical protein
VLHFTALAYSRADGQTSDHFTDVENLVYDPEFIKYMPDAFSPVGLMLDEWGDDIRTDTSHDYKIIAINDVEQDWKGKIYVRIIENEKIISEQSTDIVIPSFGQTAVTINLNSPPSPGTFTVVASLERENEKPVKSIREIPFI